MRSEWHFNKTQPASARGVVGTKHPSASEAGVQMLRQGGNAVDAAVAAAFASGVVEPWMNGIGGGGLMVIHMARQKRTAVIDYGMRAGQHASPEMFTLGEGYAEELFAWRKVIDDANIHGYKSIAVPGTVAGLNMALDQFGTLDLATVMAPAIRLAEEGFPLEWYTSLQITLDAAVIARYPQTAAIFFKNGFPRVPAIGVKPIMFTQPDHARTLRGIATDGANSFYKGDLARTIVRTIQEHDGLLTEADLAGYKPQLHEGGLSLDYSGYQIVATPAPSGGPTLSETLAILEGLDVGNLGHNSPLALHYFAEAARLAFADRFAHLADPDGGAAYQWLFSPGYATRQRARIKPDQALREVHAGLPEDGSTTHLCAIDGEHNMVSLTQTLLSRFGSRVTIDGTGILMNNGMMWFNPEPGTPNSVTPGKRPLSNMAPLLVLQEGRPLLAVGSSGGRRIINANTQVAMNVMHYGMDAQAAIDAPRVDYSTAQLMADDRIPAATIEELHKRGHDVALVHEAISPKQFASPVAILIDPESGLIYGGTDPFNQGNAVGL